MDEPISHLDYGDQLRIAGRSANYRGTDMAIILDHSPDHASCARRRVVALHEEASLADGSAGDVITPSLLQTMYDVEVQILPAPRSTNNAAFLTLGLT